jgi:hypothetical protein
MDVLVALSRRWPGSEAWYQPFVFVLVLPLFTVPATIALRFPVESTCWRSPEFCDMICPLHCPSILVIATLAPGLLGMVSLGWSRSNKAEVRRAAYIATTMAALRVGVPVVDILYTDVLTGGTTLMFGPSTVFSLLVSPLLWLTTLFLLVLYGVFGVERSPENPSPLSDDASERPSAPSPRKR